MGPDDTTDSIAAAREAFDDALEAFLEEGGFSG